MLRSARRWCVLVLAMAFGPIGCSSPSDPGLEVTSADNIEVRFGGSVTFLTLRVVLAENMAALFEGAVVLDGAGCLRLGSLDGPTAVWPKGYTFESGPAGILVRDGEGALVGRVGASFSLGGGEVPSLHDAMGFNQADRDLAEAHCPGLYWIVAAES